MYNEYDDCDLEGCVCPTRSDSTKTVKKSYISKILNFFKKKEIEEEREVETVKVTITHSARAGLDNYTVKPKPSAAIVWNNGIDSLSILKAKYSRGSNDKSN